MDNSSDLKVLDTNKTRYFLHNLYRILLSENPFLAEKPSGNTLQYTRTDWWAPEPVFFRENRIRCSSPHFPACQAECDSLDDSWHHEMAMRFHSLIKWGHPTARLACEKQCVYPVEKTLQIGMDSTLKFLGYNYEFWCDLQLSTMSVILTGTKDVLCPPIVYPSHILMDGRVKVVSFIVGSLEKHVS